ncbi:MAG: acetyltransferase [Ginsengibacter sp.]
MYHQRLRYMLIIGAGGHAKELLDVLISNGYDNLFFYDDLPANTASRMFSKFQIIKKEQEATRYFKQTDKRFVLGMGGSILRQSMAVKLHSLGGDLTTVISKKAQVSDFDVSIGDGVNIMHHVIIQPSVVIGEGTLINASALVHHDTVIGKYCEMAPAAIITGGCMIGDFTFIGSGAIILPGLCVGKNVVIGAGAVVTKDVADNAKVSGIPAKAMNKND